MALSTTFISSLICCILTVAKTSNSPLPLTPLSTTTTVQTPTSTAVPTLLFSCLNGLVNGLSGDDIHLESIVILKGNGKMCHSLNNDCDWKGKSKKVHVRYDEDETNKDVVAGKNPHYYELECKSGYVDTAEATAITISEPDPTYIHRVVPGTAGSNNRIQLTLHKKNQATQVSGPVAIGEELLLKITVPDQYNGIPISCNASSDTKYALLWDKGGCTSKDKVIMDDNWTAVKNILSIKMYAFRFVDSASVTIKCSAYVCSDKDTDCKTEVKDCLTQNVGRRRRNSDIVTKHLNEYREKSSSVSFTVVDRYGGANGSRGVSANIVLHLTAALITMYLLKGK